MLGKVAGAGAGVAGLLMVGSVGATAAAPSLMRLYPGACRPEGAGRKSAVRARGRVAVLAFALGVACLGSCSHAKSPPATSPATSAGRAQVYSAAVSEVRDYLMVWRERGCPVATREFLVPDGGCDLMLRSGKVISYQPYRWVSRNHFTLVVTLDLHFKGSPGAWNVGLNSRFITFSRAAALNRYLMYMATGP